MKTFLPALLVATAASVGTALPDTARAQSDACSASGATLSAAKVAFELSCPNLPRTDCDPIGGGWVCSTAVLGNRAPGGVRAPSESQDPASPADPAPEPAPAPNDPAPAAPVVADGVCESVPSDSLSAAKADFDSRCDNAGYAREDCDPVSGGRWVCSSVSFSGASWSGDEQQPAPAPAQPEPAPTEPEPAPAQPEPAPAQPEPAPVVSGGGGSGGSIGRVDGGDLLALHYDNCPDRDDGHAVAAGLSVVETVGLSRPYVVNGTCGDNQRGGYQPKSVAVLNATWGGDWVDAYNGGSAAVNATADAYAAVLAAGDDVWVAEGGPSDFTARVLRRIGSIYPNVDRKRIHVVQHSVAWNEKNTTSANIATVKGVANYITIADGNRGGNGTADLNQLSSSFVAKARSSRFATAWNAAFDYLNPNNRLDFSDTVELLWIINDTSTGTVNDFGDRYL